MKFFIETSWASLNHFGEELCGDKVEIVKRDNGILLVLSDGLGSGVKANILASLTSKIISSMVSAGADISDVVETIASTLPVCKVRNVAYSTFTLMQVDKDGNAYFVEFDNPSLVLMREGKRVYVPWVEQTIAGKQIRQAHMKLKLGDIAITFSDGVIHAGVGQVLNFGWQHENVVKFLEETSCPDDKASDVQHRLLMKSNELYNGQCGDDTTVAVLRVTEPVPCCVMVGPPVNPADDEDVVNDLMSCTGIRVICGGTTSQIVSKRLGKELQIDLNYISADVPPIAHMEGVDLVTEGIITVSRVIEYAKDALGQNERHEEWGYGHDGACLISRMLFEEATDVNFFVGRAVNPAHQDPNLPISFNIKMKLVEELSKLLHEMGKRVKVMYF